MKVNQTKSSKPLGGFKMWLMILMIYIVLFLGIGYIAFWEQDFNDPDKFLVKYESLRQKHFEILNGSNCAQLNEEQSAEYNNHINEYMKIANDSAGDLQELASQSFNIVLGAFLAFLSASASILFQENSFGNRKDE